MKLNVIDPYILSSKVLLVLYLPVSFFIWYIVLNTNAEPIIGISTILSILTFLYFVVFLKYQHLDKNFILFFLFTLYILFYIFIIKTLEGDLVDIYGRSVFRYHLNTLILSTMSYIIGRNFIVFKLKWQLALFSLMLVQILYNANLINLSINLDNVEGDLTGLYLGLSDIFCITSLLLFGSVDKSQIKFKIVLIFLSSLGLFILNSRSSLYIYLICIIFYFLITFKHIKSIKTIFYLFLSTTVIGLIFFDKINTLLVVNDRMFAVILKSDDASSNERSRLQNIGINQITSNPIFGDYGGVVKINADLGTYIHNLLSYWQTYGLLVFIISLYFFIYQTAKVFRLSYILNYKFNNHYNYIMLLSSYLLLSTVFAKSYTWFSAWFVLGILHNFLYNYRLYKTKYTSGNY